MMDTQEFMERVYSMLNAEGHGYAIGSPEQGLFGAIAATPGLLWNTRYTSGLIVCTDSAGNTVLVGGDAMGRNAWAVTVPAE
jgi:hypothetical protein